MKLRDVTSGLWSRPVDPSRRRAVFAVAILASTALVGCDGSREKVAGALRPVDARELQAAATEPKVKAFYEARQWRPAWSSANGKVLLDVLQGAQQHGLDPSPFARIIQAAEGRAARDVELTQAALAYAQALASGTVDPGQIHAIYTLDRPKTDVAAGLSQALDSNQLTAWLESLAPQDPEYRTLGQAYLAYQARSVAAAAAPIPTGARLRAGGRDPRTPAIAKRLSEEGYFDAAQAAAATEVFTSALAKAVKTFQGDQQLPTDGAVNDAVIEALNTVSADRARQLAVNLERRRWLARNPAPTRIDVNTAATQLVYLRDNQPVWTSRTVVGSPENPTPALGETFKQLVVNPPWNVPQGIAEKEILPKGEAYLARSNMYVEDGKVVQRPGPDTALGLVKFDMQNRYAIYLHDTPAKALFQSRERHRSHGCVRVENAVEFARRLAADYGKSDAFEAALASPETKVVPLGQDLAVRLLYHTVYINDAGQLVFADDPYGLDERLAGVMGLGPGRRRGGGGGTVVALLGP